MRIFEIYSALMQGCKQWT